MLAKDGASKTRPGQKPDRRAKQPEQNMRSNRLDTLTMVTALAALTVTGLTVVHRACAEQNAQYSRGSRRQS